MFVCLVKVKLQIYSTASLKEKRSVLKSLLERTKHKFSLSIAEVGDSDLWQSAEIGLALVGNNKIVLEKELSKILQFIESSGEVEIASADHEIWSYQGGIM